MPSIDKLLLNTKQSIQWMFDFHDSFVLKKIYVGVIKYLILKVHLLSYILFIQTVIKYALIYNCLRKWIVLCCFYIEKNQ